jgi:hypothetical protein
MHWHVGSDVVLLFLPQTAKALPLDFVNTWGASCGNGFSESTHFCFGS